MMNHQNGKLPSDKDYIDYTEQMATIEYWVTMFALATIAVCAFAVLDWFLDW